MTAARAIRATRAERGSITLAALVLVIPLLVLGFAYLSLATRHNIERDMRSQLRVAEDLAQSGIDRALVELVNDPSFERGQIQLDNGAVNYAVVERWNDTDSRFARIRSTGFTNPIVDDIGNLVASPASAHRTVLAVARERTHEYDVRQGLFLADPNAQIQVSGTDFAIEGSDLNYSDHQAGGDGSRPALVTTGVVNAIKGQLSASQWVNLRGLGGTPSIAQRLGQDELVQKLIEYYHSSASVRFGPDSRYDGGSLGDPAQDHFIVSYATGNLTLSGPTTGAGMLLVTGDLTVDRALNFTGIIAVQGRLILAGSGPQDAKSIMGTVLVGDDLTIDARAITSGSMTLQYSSEAAATAKRRAGRYSVEAIMQGS